MNKVLLLILISLFLNSCSFKKNQTPLGKKTNPQQNKSTKTILTKQVIGEQEFNSQLEIKFSEKKFNTNSDNNQNDIGEMSYQGLLEKIGKYKFSNFSDFKYIDPKPIFYQDNLVFFDNKGTIILYDLNQKIIWKKNFYSKSEKKAKPRLNMAVQKNILIVTDNFAKYYAINLNTGEMIWEKKNTFPTNSDVKIKDSAFYLIDYNNTLMSISIKDGSLLWKLKTEKSLTKSNTKLSIVMDNEKIYFNNSIGDITAAVVKSGELLWQIPTQSTNINNNAFQLATSKLILNENSILFSNNKREFYSIDIKTGLINWKNEINSVLRPTIIGKFIITVSTNGYLYIVEKKSGNIVRINDLYKNFENKKRAKVTPTGFMVGMSKVYLTNDDGKLIIANLNTGIISSIVKIAGEKISQPYVSENNLFLIKNGSIIKYN